MAFAEGIDLTGASAEADAASENGAPALAGAPAHEKAELSAELRRVKADLARVTEERNILKKAAAYFARESQ